MEIISDDGSSARLTSENVMLKRDIAGISVPSRITMSYRFHLGNDAIPGTYAWPLNMTVSLATQ